MPKVEHTVATTTEFDGTSGKGLVINAFDGGPNQFAYITQVLWHSANACDITLTLKDGASARNVVVNQSSTADYVSTDMDVLVPDGWSVVFETSSKTADGTMVVFYDIRTLGEVD